MEKYESGFSEKAKREFDNALVDRKLYVFIFLFFFFFEYYKTGDRNSKNRQGEKTSEKGKKKIPTRYLEHNELSMHTSGKNPW